MKLVTIIRFAIVILMLGCFQHALAMSVQPMISEIAPIGSNARSSMTVVNNSSTAITVEASAWHIVSSTDGKETLEFADDDILVFPPTAVIGAGKSQLMQIQYIGDPELRVSKFYRLRVEQLPVKLEESTDAVNISYQIGTILIVDPEHSKSDLVINSIKPTEAGTYEISLQNNGTRYVSLNQMRWTLQSLEGDISLSEKQISESINRNYVFPESSLMVVFTPPEGVSSDNATLLITGSE
jgi:P pilus assembly chaperone PapD